MDELIKDLRRVDKLSKKDGSYRPGKVTGVLNTYNMHQNDKFRRIEALKEALEDMKDPNREKQEEKCCGCF